MNMENLTPAGGGKLRGPAEPVRQPVRDLHSDARQHPDEIWNPRGGSWPRQSARSAPRPTIPGAESERPASPADMGANLHRTLRAALRPGTTG